MQLEDKIVLVTGASSGIGEATAKRFAKEKSKVIVHYNQTKEGAEKVVTEITSNGGYAESIKADLSIENEIIEVFQNINNKYGKIDILINNAASPTEKSVFEETTQQDILDLLNINIASVMLCSKYAINLMKKDGGKIINTTSIKGWEEGGGSSIVYGATKAAINSFTKTLAKRVSPNIQVNAVAPGYVKTRIYDGQSEERINKWLEGTYLKRWITVEEIADAFIFLSKNDAITGQVLYVDGGYTLK